MTPLSLLTLVLWVIFLMIVLSFAIYILTYKNILKIYTNLFPVRYRNVYLYIALFPLSLLCVIVFHITSYMLQT